MKVAFTLLYVLSLTIGITTPSVWAVNRVLSLDGDGDYVEVPTDASLNLTTQLTLETWFTNNFPEIGVFLIVKSGNIGGAYNYRYGLYITDDSTSVRLYLNLQSNGVTIARYSEHFADGEWYHFAGTFDGQIMRLYVNGIECDSLDLGSEDNVTIDNNPLQIGTWLGRSTFHSGLIDEVRIWNVARTQEEIQSAMNTTLTGREEGLVGYWNFDAGAATDLSPNGNDGALHGDARIVEKKLPDEFIHKGAVALEDKIANPGDQFAVNISVRFAKNLHSFNFDLTFDPAVLRAVSVKEGPFLSRDGVDATSWQTPTIDNQKGVISNIRSSRTGKEGIEEKGVLASVTFEAIEMGYADLVFQHLRLLSPTGEEIKASAKKGKIKVYPHGSISGVVLDSASEEPIKGARVEVSKDNFAFGLWAYSADDGTYTLNGVPVGDFDVTAHKGDFMSETISKVRVEQGKNTPDIDIKITGWW